MAAATAYERTINVNIDDNFNDVLNYGVIFDRHITSLMEYAASLGAAFSPISVSFSENICLSSVLMMALIGVPRIFNWYFARTPSS